LDVERGAERNSPNIFMFSSRAAAVNRAGTPTRGPRRREAAYGSGLQYMSRNGRLGRMAYALKLYKSNDAKQAAFREAAIHVAAETSSSKGLERPKDRRSVGDRVRPSASIVIRQKMSNSRDDVTRYLECMVQLHLRIHAHEAIQLAILKVRLAANIAAATLLDEPQRHRLLIGVADMPAGDRLCHGDFHPMNILGAPLSSGSLIRPDARRGDPAADVCRSYLFNEC
jgi:hypothetical protein